MIVLGDYTLGSYTDVHGKTVYDAIRSLATHLLPLLNVLRPTGLSFRHFAITITVLDVLWRSDQRRPRRKNQ